MRDTEVTPTCALRRHWIAASPSPPNALAVCRRAKRGRQHRLVRPSIQRQASESSPTTFPGVRMPVKMEHRYHQHDIVLGGKEDSIGKDLKQCSTNAGIDLSELQRTLQHTSDGLVQLGFESESKARSLALVVERGREDFAFRFLA